MAKRRREYVDKNREVMATYYELSGKYNDSNRGSIKTELKELIQKDPDFLDPYLLLYKIFQEENNLKQADEILNDAYKRAMKLIKDKRGNWPDVLEWGWLQNRHIIRAILNKAISLWQNKEVGNALELFRKLLKTNPGDNVGARHYILAIRMKMSFEEFEKRFNKGGYYDMELPEWFDKNYKKFPGEFGWWEKASQQYK